MRFGILSTAKIGVKVIAAINDNPNSVVVAVGSRSLEKSKEFATKNKIPTAYGSYQELLDDP
jgi:predicted dehydrogenase